MNVRLVGEANDYVAKSMSGGEISYHAARDHRIGRIWRALLVTACLYGATGGRVFISGRAGERFAVRNSLGEAVVEGTGDHCCEY